MSWDPLNQSQFVNPGEQGHVVMEQIQAQGYELEIGDLNPANILIRVFQFGTHVGEYSDEGQSALIKLGQPERSLTDIVVTNLGINLLNGATLAFPEFVGTRIDPFFPGNYSIVAQASCDDVPYSCQVNFGLHSQMQLFVNQGYFFVDKGFGQYDVWQRSGFQSSFVCDSSATTITFGQLCSPQFP